MNELLTKEDIEYIDSLSKEEKEWWEELIKKCPRCGGTSANKSNPQGRCSACLKKLSHAKKTPGSSQRAQTKADDALRRQKGDSPTAHKKSSGLGSREGIVKKVKSAEKKTGQKLSPDRKQNGSGYASSNVRMVPEHLNRGRHKVDPKKLAEWKKRLKKSSYTPEDLKNVLLVKALIKNDQELLDFLKDLHIDQMLSEDLYTDQSSSEDTD